MARRTRKSSALALGAVALATLVVAQPAAASHTSVGVPSPYDGTPIWITVYRPAAASATNKVPVVLHSHGWGGTRTSSEGAFSSWTGNGFAVVSIDQRGHGQTGGTAYLQNPDIEGQDIKGVIDYVATLPWVRKDLDGGGNEIANDPVLGAIGGSYGGGYQTVTALTEIRDTGRTRFNALAPEITWNDLPRSLAPQDVPRTLWTVGLYAVGATRVPDYVHQSFALGLATATFPNGEIAGTYDLKDRFYRNSPAWFAANGYHLDVPVLFGQGVTDNLFPLNEAYHSFTEVLTPAARAKSLLIGYNGGHVIPSVVPLSTMNSGDACSGGFEALSRSFFGIAFAGGNPATLQPKPYNITSATGTCLRADSLDTYSTLPVGTVVTPTAAGAPVGFPIATGPVTVVGIPVLKGKLTTAGVESRAFFALSMGASPATAQIVQNNVMPLRQVLPVTDQPFSLELPGIAVSVPAGQTLYLTASAVSDMFAGAGRTPGAMLLTDAAVDLPVA